MTTTDMKPTRRERGQQLKALEAFANLGDTLDEWRAFLDKCGLFFPERSVALWIQEATQMERVQADPARAGLHEKEWGVLNLVSEGWNDYSGSLGGSAMALEPSLFFYRKMLRAVWTHNDAKGYALAILLGFPEQVEDEARTGVPLLFPLPSGRAVVDGVTGAINWEFGCQFQQAVYELMKERWRTKVCPVCGRYFLAAKTAQTLCSSRCFKASKRKRALDWWNRKGRKRRARKSRRGRH
jgi:hypothetical protein